MFHHFLFNSKNNGSTSFESTLSSSHESSIQSSSSSESSEATIEIENRNVSTGRLEKGQPSNNEYQPSVDFEVSLLGNKSVQIIIESPPLDVDVIWFNDDAVTRSTDSVDCLVYPSNPVIIDGLEENTTYIFCGIPRGAKEISPLNCVPVRIPGLDLGFVKWIGNGNKHFTITMIILSFAGSLVFGSVISYFTIKTYPDLVEGGKHVIHVRREPMEHISYITKADCEVVGGSCYGVGNEKQQGSTIHGAEKKK